MVSWIKKKGGVNDKCYHTVWLSCTYHYYNLIKTLGLQELGKRTIEQHLNGDIILTLSGAVKKERFLNVASDGNMLVYIPLDKKSSWYLFGVMPPLEYGVGSYFPQPAISLTLCCQEAHNFMLQVMET